ncbi:MAG: hypothetical protein EXS13_14730 [Planctomycetes bacterium]|nr:hypothetical protein [Planctomycetota bacterium]
MSKETPDHHDAELALRTYELRREPVMRASRDAIIGKFLPRTLDELLAITKPDHPLNAAWRQVTTYWEGVYAIVKHGIVHPEYFLESNGEGLLVYSRVVEHLAGYRNATSPFAFLNAEWVATHTVRGKLITELFLKRYRTQLGAVKAVQP